MWRFYSMNIWLIPSLNEMPLRNYFCFIFSTTYIFKSLWVITRYIVIDKTDLTNTVSCTYLRSRWLSSYRNSDTSRTFKLKKILCDLNSSPKLKWNNCPNHSEFITFYQLISLRERKDEPMKPRSRRYNPQNVLHPSYVVNMYPFLGLIIQHGNLFSSQCQKPLVMSQMILIDCYPGLK